MDENQFYTSIEDAKEEIQRRWNDVELRKKVEEYFKNDFPEPLKKGPRAIFSRSIIAPDNEFLRFVELAKKTNLDPLLFEYSKDKFVAKNPDKFGLGKLIFYDKKIKNSSGYPRMKVVNFNIYEGKKFCDIKTLWGEGLADFYHDVLDEACPNLKSNIFDISDWFNRTRYATEYYYLYYLGLFVCHGILFENILASDHEKEFSEKKIIPSFNKLKDIFGIKPLIVPIAPIKIENDFYWWCYPKDIKKIIEEKLILIDKNNEKVEEKIKV